ncbi:MAG: class I SAM-dependent methyltransferase [Ignavibacteria bacterium]|nr:class I SAM-dependent methyltransferase [Ignavibacteria bacterium]
MNQPKFSLEKFCPFEQSTKVDGNYTGMYDEKVIRVVEINREEYKLILNFKNDLEQLVKTNLYYEDDTIIALEHEKLENITYYTEWTKKQKVAAAKAIIHLQSKLVEKGFYLNDPHAFNITFKYHKPVYFDFGSIKKGKINSAWWFIKGFCGWTERDYWDDVLKINSLQKLFISFRMLFSPNPYNHLSKKVMKFEKGLIEKKLINIISSKSLFGKINRKFVSSVPFIFKNLSNWSDYDQKSPKLNFDDARNKNLLKIIKTIKPSKVLDIGANRGAFCLLALENGAEEAIAIDLDNYSLDYLLNEVEKQNLNITVAKLNLMDYPEKPGCFESYLPAHTRLSCDFAICLAVVHHVCYFGNSSFDDFAEKLNRFTNKILVVEFVPYNDIHLTGAKYKGKDRSWYTLDNFIESLKKYFPSEPEIYDSTPSPRLLLKFNK